MGIHLNYEVSKLNKNLFNSSIWTIVRALIKNVVNKSYHVIKIYNHVFTATYLFPCNQNT